MITFRPDIQRRLVEKPKREGKAPGEVADSLVEAALDREELDREVLAELHSRLSSNER